LRWPVADDLPQRITGLTVNDVDRRGKYLLLETTQGRLMIHLGMSGSLRVLPEGTPVEKHDHIDLLFDDRRVLRYRDPRRFGSFFWLPETESHSLLDSLGPEPLSDQFDGDYLFSLSRKKSMAIKQFVMDSKVVVGVGNIYANESLFLAGIHPARKAGSVSKKRYLVLADHIKQVLAAAIKSGGTTLRDFVKEDGEPGYFSQALRVYGRGGEPCVGCGAKLADIRLGQRTTVFCRRCQT
jgi:formamidopyrimidine-DNA glycosylase